MNQVLNPFYTLKDTIDDISEREISRDPTVGIKAISSLADQLQALNYDEDEVLLKRSVAQLVALDLKRVIAATNTDEASRAYIDLTHTVIRLARALIKEGSTS
jgi:hypothetical protein